MSTIQQSNQDGGAKRKTKKVVKKQQKGGLICNKDSDCEIEHAGQGYLCRNLPKYGSRCLSPEYLAEMKAKRNAQIAAAAAAPTDDEDDFYGGAKRKTKKVLKKRGGEQYLGSCVNIDDCVEADDYSNNEISKEKYDCKAVTGSPSKKCVPKSSGGAKRKTKKVQKKRGGGDPPNNANAPEEEEEEEEVLEEPEEGGAKRKTKKVQKKRGGDAACGTEGLWCPSYTKCAYNNGQFKCVAGGGATKAVYKGGSYVVHIGKRGGKYIVVKGQKVYVNKK
jgi:hypothetical protein